MKFKLLSKIFIMVLCLALLSGCGPTSSQNGKSGINEKGEVTVKVTFDPAEWSDTIEEEFESANPGIKVERVSADNSKLLSMIAAGTAPDIIRIKGSQLPTYITRGLALDIQDRVEKSEIIDQNDFLPVVDIYKWDGKKTGEGPLYGLPKDWSLDLTFFINKTLFEKHGIPLPDDKKPMTFEQMVDYSKKLHEESNGQTVVFGSCGWEITFLLSSIETYLEQMGKSLWSEDFLKVDLNNDDIKKIFNMMNEHMQSKSVASVLNPAPGDYPGLFSEGKAGMFQTGYWFSGQLRSGEMTKNKLDDYMMLPSIQLEGGERLSACTAATGAIIMKSTTHPDEAFKFFEYFFAGKPADDRAKIGFGLPIFKSKLDLLPMETDFDKQIYNVTMDEMEKSSKIYIQNNPYIDKDAAEAVFERELAPVYFGKATIDEVLPILESEIQKLIDEGAQIAGVK